MKSHLTGRWGRRAMDHKRTVRPYVMYANRGGGGHERMVVGPDRPGRLVRCLASGRADPRPGPQARLAGPGSAGRGYGRDTSRAREAAPERPVAPGWATRRLSATTRATWPGAARPRCSR